MSACFLPKSVSILLEGSLGSHTYCPCLIIMIVLVAVDLGFVWTSEPSSEVAFASIGAILSQLKSHSINFLAFFSPITPSELLSPLSCCLQLANRGEVSLLVATSREIVPAEATAANLRTVNISSSAESSTGSQVGSPQGSTRAHAQKYGVVGLN